MEVQGCHITYNELGGLQSHKGVLELVNNVLTPLLSLADPPQKKKREDRSGWGVLCGLKDIDYTASMNLLDSLVHLHWTPVELSEFVLQIISINCILGSVVIWFSTYWFLCSFWITIPLVRWYNTLADCIRRRKLPEDFNTLDTGLRLIFFRTLPTFTLVHSFTFLVISSPTLHTGVILLQFEWYRKEVFTYLVEVLGC